MISTATRPRTLGGEAITFSSCELAVVRRRVEVVTLWICGVGNSANGVTDRRNATQVVVTVAPVRASSGGAQVRADGLGRNLFHDRSGRGCFHHGRGFRNRSNDRRGSRCRGRCGELLALVDDGGRLRDGLTAGCRESHSADRDGSGENDARGGDADDPFDVHARHCTPNHRELKPLDQHLARGSVQQRCADGLTTYLAGGLPEVAPARRTPKEI